jgi:hypothetical protein
MGGDEVTPWHHPVIQIDKKVKGYGEDVHFDQLKTNHFKWLIWLSCNLLSSPPLSLSSWVLPVSLILEAQSTLSNPPHKTCQPDCNSVWLDKHHPMCNIYPCLLLCKIVCYGNTQTCRHLVLQGRCHWISTETCLQLSAGSRSQSDGQPTDFGLHNVHRVWWENIIHAVIHNVKTWDTQFSHIM